ncbi:twitching motility protein PilT [Candidatus Acidianus copahuensis]|uniref:Twitching motility protein PilT n=1 Tax=Candidatus Acidianus copahuensis TaxID=1160895 RepID=A0A031LHK3_9CREN|nr:PIN domain-containing protein [Candidatus Acidianus copahuensis]EZQ01642.1 twitching motility protein PilT [Candidatus Acidianus copahuensis]
MKAVVDTNVIIFDLFEDSEYHKEASELLDKLEGWVIPDIVIHELVWFFKGLNVSLDYYTYLSSYVNDPKAEISCSSRDDIVDALNILRKEDLSLSRYNGLVIMIHALRRKLPIATFDKRLRSVSRKYGVITL